MTRTRTNLRFNYLSLLSVLVLNLIVVVVVHAKKEAKNVAAATTSTTTTTTTTQRVLGDGPEDNNVAVSFMDLKRNEFVKVVPKIKDSISGKLNEFCKQKECGTKLLNFTAKDIDFIGSTDKEKFTEEGRYVITHLYAKLPNNDEEDDDDDDNDSDSGNSNDDKKNDDKSDDESKSESESKSIDSDLKVLSKDLIEEFMTKSAGDIMNDSKVGIAYVNNKLVYPPRNNLDNWIIVSVSCGFCVILIVLNLICQKRRDKQIKDQLTKKSTIYKSDNSDKKGSSSKLSSSSQSLKNKGSRNDLEERGGGGGGGESQPLNQNTAEEYDDDPRYLEPVQRFPMPDQTPMLMTNTSRPMSNIRTNPHIRLTQV